MKKLKVLQYKWGKYNNYIGLMPYNEVANLIKTKVDFSMNRDVDEFRVKEIIQHIDKKAENLFFPPVILNSDSGYGIEFNSKSMEIALSPSNKLTIIDGQHRLSAIKDILTKEINESIKLKVKDHVIPFVLIESLESNEHRVIFNEINQNAEKVGSVVSERFEPNIQNLVCLRYISENLHFKKYIEWEKEQSDSKIVYLHLVRCIELIKKSLLRIFKKEQRKTLFSEPYHLDSNFYSIQEHFLKILLSHIDSVSLEASKREFWVKRVVLIAITESLISSIKSIEFEKYDNNTEIIAVIKENISNKLLEMLPFSTYYKYSGNTSQTRNTYEAIQKYIYINRKLELLGIEETNIKKFGTLIYSYIELFENEIDTDFEEDENIRELGDFIKGLKLTEEEIDLKDFTNPSFAQIQLLKEKIRESQK